MRKIIIPLMALLFVGIGVSAAAAQWREIGSKEVDYAVDHDTLNVTSMRGDFRKIRIGVSRAPVKFYRVVLTYGNGNTQEVQVRSLIRPGGQSRVIDLKGNERVIRKVEFWYESASLRRQKALVTLYGRD
jgi:hypothetical protein